MGDGWKRARDAARSTGGGMTSKRRAALEAIVVEINAGLIDDEECARRLDQIGATEDELDEVMK